MSTEAIERTRSGEFKTRVKIHGYAGLIIIIGAEIALFTGNQLVGRWFTPIVWTGYILFVDALVFRIKSHSLLVNDRREFLVVAIVSIAGWWLFEFYNAPRFWLSNVELWWHYHNLEPNQFLRRAGYDWAFATITPAMLETAELLDATLLRNVKPRRAVRLTMGHLIAFVVSGCLAALLPLLVISAWLVPLVWLSWILLLDPVNALRGQASITNDLASGDYRRLLSLLVGGGICGVLWEFWNYWAITKWTYTVPYLGEIKIFEMPVLGYLGFPPFAIECWAMYIFCRSLLGGTSAEKPETHNGSFLYGRLRGLGQGGSLKLHG
ncbi:MAG TPA: hypothetical protein VFV34_01200 [Blastocatellia bacterium]|nr:hypothetical protein [Blastocatellia bacterium]